MKHIFITCTLIAASLTFVSCDSKEEKAIKEAQKASETMLKTVKDANPEAAKQMEAAQALAAEAAKNITPEQIKEAQEKAMEALKAQSVTPAPEK